MSLITCVNNEHGSYEEKETEKRKCTDKYLDVLHSLYDCSADNFQAVEETVKHLTVKEISERNLKKMSSSVC